MVRRMRAEGEFTVASFVPTGLTPAPASIETGLPPGVAVMEKTYTGDVDGRSATIFTAAFDPDSGVGTYVAMESFEGSLAGRSGTFNFAHSATTHGPDRAHEHFVIVPASGTGELAGLTGSGGIDADADHHRIWFEFELG